MAEELADKTSALLHAQEQVVSLEERLAGALRLLDGQRRVALQTREGSHLRCGPSDVGGAASLPTAHSNTLFFSPRGGIALPSALPPTGASMPPPPQRGMTSPPDSWGSPLHAAPHLGGSGAHHRSDRPAGEGSAPPSKFGEEAQNMSAGRFASPPKWGGESGAVRTVGVNAVLGHGGAFSPPQAGGGKASVSLLAECRSAP